MRSRPCRSPSSQPLSESSPLLLLIAIWSVPSMTGLEVWEEEPGLWRSCRCSRSLLAELRREEACCAAVVYRGTVHADVGGGPPSPLLCRDCAAIPCIACTAASMRGNWAMECKKQTQTTRPFVRERERRESFVGIVCVFACYSSVWKFHPTVTNTPNGWSFQVLDETFQTNGWIFQLVILKFSTNGWSFRLNGKLFN